MGLMHMVTAISPRIGTRTFAVAVLDAMFVIDTVSRHTIVIIRDCGRAARLTLSSCFTRREDNPEDCEAEASANPPPSRNITPQHILVSINLHVIRLGEFCMTLLKGSKGGKLYDCGKMKRKIAMRIAGVAAPTLTFLPPAVVMLNRSQNQRINRTKNKTNT